MASRSDRSRWEALRPLARAMRRVPTRAERALWELLRNRQLLGMKFRRQHVIGRYIVDFYCAEQRLVIEVDGNVHLSRLERDVEREQALGRMGIAVLRFSNHRVCEDPAGVLGEIARWLRAK